MISSPNRLRKHADYQRVYKSSRKQFGKQFTYFFSLQVPPGNDVKASPPAASCVPRIGLTVSKAMGNAVQRNRLKRRMREAVRRQVALVTAPVDVILHPRTSVADLDFGKLQLEIASAFRQIVKASGPKP